MQYQIMMSLIIWFNYYNYVGLNIYLNFKQSYYEIWLWSLDIITDTAYYYFISNLFMFYDKKHIYN